MVIWWRRWTGGFERSWAFGFWEFWVCPIVCSTGEEWGSNEFESSRQVLGLELGDEEFKCKEFWPKFLDGSGREEEKGLTRLPKEDASMTATPSGVMDASTSG